MSFLNQDELEQIGFAKIGLNVQISRFSSFYNPANIFIDNNTRIDDFCVISAGHGGIHIGKNVHLAVYVSIMGSAKITLDDFSGLSSRVSVYSSNDDYSGKFLTNPTVPKEFTNVVSKEIQIDKHVIIGSGSVVLPGIHLEEGVAIGALSLVSKSCKANGIYTGNPLKFLKTRKLDYQNLEKNYINSL